VVGDVVRLRDQLAWFERQPLFGRRIVITRPRAQAAEFAESLEAWGAEVVSFPTIETTPPPSWAPLDHAIERAQSFAWVVFTSANGVRVFFERLQALNADVRDWQRARFAAIGPQTAKALRAYCVRVEVVADEFRAEGVVAALGRAGVAGQRILLPRAAGARQVLPQQLRDQGADVEEVITYTTVPPSSPAVEICELLRRGEVDLVTFTSSSAVHNFVSLLGGDAAAALAGAAVGCIGPVTAETARSYGMEVAVEPAAYTTAAFADAIVHYYAQAPAKTRRAAGGD